MKNKMIIVCFVFIIVIVGVSVIFLANSNNKKKKYINLIEVNTQERTRKIVKKQKIEKNKNIEFKKYSVSDIKILDFNEEYVEISRIVEKYKAENYEKYEEEIIEKINYNESINVDKDRYNPLVGISLYNYYIEFTK